MSDTKYIIVDIDGTIADCSQRIRHIVPPIITYTDTCGAKTFGLDPGFKKDWDAFYDEEEMLQDKPIPGMSELLHGLKSEYHWLRIVYLTGRPEKTRKTTEAWIERNGFPAYWEADGSDLLMRPDGNFEDDSSLKIKMLANAGIYPEDILFALEDRTRIVKAFRAAGIRTFQVADGDF